MKTFFPIIFFLFSSIFFYLFGEEVPFPADKDCVAWKTKKSMFLVKVKDPVGINCQIRIETVAEGNKTRVKVYVPVAGFDSGEPDRDSEVIKILKAKEHPDILFVSDPLDPKEWKQGNPTELPGTLTVAGHPTPIRISVKKDAGKNLLTGYIVSKFSTFKVEPPSVAFGVVADVQDYLELHFKASIPK